ncbi:hypothetical protein ACFVT5_38580 [Streptomyces sp. NPDC058001]|uniref:hypothetical protein n=1 Tax=Streptomyces sp. NPDC058001 TaxID=3346300 RepID=UPI0036EE88B9
MRGLDEHGDEGHGVTQGNDRVGDDARADAARTGEALTGNAPADEGRDGDGQDDGATAGRGGRWRRLTRDRRGRLLLAGGAALVLLAAGTTTSWATGSWPFPGDDRYCWGSWQENSGPGFLGDDAFIDGNGSRSSTATAPTPARPTGTCTVAVDTGYTARDGDEVNKTSEVTVTYGPAPKDARERMAWLVDLLGDGTAPMPDRLPGTVSGGKGMLVLPKRCDTADGRPTTVTLASKASQAYEGRSTASSAGLGGTRWVTALLVAAANQGMERAGCADGEPLRTSSPVLRVPEDEERYFTNACRIPGLKVDPDLARDLEYRVGAVTRDLQSCAVQPWRGAGDFYTALMVAEPRLAALFDGTTGTAAPAPGWRGTGIFTDTYKVVRADCAGRPATFLTHGMSDRDTVAFTDAVTQRLGCPPVAPRA